MTKQKRKINKKRIYTIILSIIIILTCVGIIRHTYLVVKYPEQMSSVERYHFMCDLNDNEEEAIERYEEAYISRDVYLFDGPCTIKMCCKKYNLDYDVISQDYKESNYQSFQEYFDNEIK